MGGYGASRLGMKYPGIFAALYIMSPCCMSARGAPEHVRSDNGREFAATAVREWIAGVGSMTAFIEPGSPWENGYVESFNRKLRDEVLNGEIYYTLREAQVLIEAERRHFNTCRTWSFWRGVSGRKHLRPNVRLAVASGQSPQLG
jgi:transposase InsO family protein